MPEKEDIKGASSIIHEFAVLVLLEATELASKIYEIKHDRNLNRTEKKRRITKEISSSYFSLAGGVIGNALIPYPYFGSFIGSRIGRVVGIGVCDQFLAFARR